MAKSKLQEPDSSSSKRKKHSCEREVCVEGNTDRKVKKKRKKAGTEEEPPISALPQPVQDDAPMETKNKKHKQPTELVQKEKRHKKKRVEKHKQPTELAQKEKRHKKKHDEEEPPISELPQPVQDDALMEAKPKKHKQPTELAQKEKRHKKKRVEIAEPTIAPLVTQGEEEEEEEEVVLEDLSPEERRVLERKMKKILKKDKLQTEGKAEAKVEATKPIAPQQALDYLTCWAENRKEWKFQKTRQTWLLQHMFDSEQVPDQSFTVLLSYLEGLRGAARDTTVQKAETLVQGQGPEAEAQKRACRAREVIQLLS